MNVRLRIACLVCLVVIGGLSSRANAQEEKGFVRGLVGMTFGTETSSIFGGGGGFRIAKHVQLIGEAGRMQNVAPKEIQDEVDLESALLSADLGVPVTVNVKVPAVYAMGGIRMNVPTMRRFHPFVDVGVGVASISADFDAEVDGTDISDELENELDLQSESKFLFAIGGGVAIPLTQRTALDVAYRFHRIATEDPAINASAILAGFRFNFK